MRVFIIAGLLILNGCVTAREAKQWADSRYQAGLMEGTVKANDIALDCIDRLSKQDALCREIIKSYSEPMP